MARCVLRCLRSTFAAFALFVVSVSVHAQSPSAVLIPAAALAYEAPRPCPSKDEFLVAARARMQELQQSAFNPTQKLNVVITAEPAGYSGVLRISVDGTQVLERTLNDYHCGALVEGLALVAVMALAPASTQSPNQVSARSPSATSRQPNINAAATSAENAERSQSLDWMVAAMAGLQTAPAPSALFSAGLHLGVLPRRIVQSYGISLVYGQTGLLDFAGGDVRFRWSVARLIGCPLGYRYRGLSLLACGLAEIGWLRAEPHATLHGTPANGLWIAPGLAGSVSVQHAGFVVDALVGAVRPLVRDDFFFGSTGASRRQELVHQTPSIGLATELKLGILF